MTLPFRQRLSLEHRQRELQRVLRNHPDHVPTIITRHTEDDPPLAREKFLLPKGLTGAELCAVVRRHLPPLPEGQALFLLCGDTMVNGQTTVMSVWDAHRDPDDGFLYVVYTMEHTFGGARD